MFSCDTECCNRAIRAPPSAHRPPPAHGRRFQHVEVLCAKPGGAFPGVRPVEEPLHPTSLDVEHGGFPVQNRGGTLIVRRQSGLRDWPANASRGVVEVALHQGGAPAGPDSRSAAKHANGVSVPPVVPKVSVVDRVHHVRARLGGGSGLEDQHPPVRLGQFHRSCDSSRARTDHEGILRLADGKPHRWRDGHPRVARPGSRRPVPGRPARSAWTPEPSERQENGNGARRVSCVRSPWPPSSVAPAVGLLTEGGRGDSQGAVPVVGCLGVRQSIATPAEPKMAIRGNTRRQSAGQETNAPESAIR